MNFEFWRKDRPEIDRSGDDNDSDLDETDEMNGRFCSSALFSGYTTTSERL